MCRRRPWAGVRPGAQGAGQVWADDLTLDVVDPKDIKTTMITITSTPRGPRTSTSKQPLPTPPLPSLAGRSSPECPQLTLARCRGGAHGGRAYLEIRSTHQGTPSIFAARQDIAGEHYKSKRVRFRAYLKTEAVADVAYVSITSSRIPPRFATAEDQGSKGTTDWRPHEAVLDVPADAEGLSIAVILRGAGSVGVDDASLEVVDPAKVPLTPKSEVAQPNPESAREMAEALSKMPDRPQNLDFEHRDEWLRKSQRNARLLPRVAPSRRS